MTAEIAVFNKSAVALAADSAVTIQGNGTHKIYNGAEKLFALSKKYPIGIMVYGAGSLCRVPWELIIKEYRKQIPNKPFNTLEQQAEHFWRFVKQSDQLIPVDMREIELKERFVSFFIEHIHLSVLRKVERYVLENGKKPSIEETYTLYENRCGALLKEFAGCPFYPDFDEQDISKVQIFAEPVAYEILQDTFSEEVKAPNLLVEALSSVFAHVTCKNVGVGSNTGVVFAGYGEKEYFPVVLAFNLRGFFEQKLRLANDPDKSIGGGASGLRAYAQSDEVDVFVQGISSRIYGYISDSYAELIQEVLECSYDVISRLTGDLDTQSKCKESLAETASQLWNKHEEKILTHIQKGYSDKVVNMIEFLPKKELAEMAESLVNLTAFKRKVSDESETVGGPIDVAIISKGDGFIWVKRKHYFEKDLNYHYFNNRK